MRLSLLGWRRWKFTPFTYGLDYYDDEVDTLAGLFAAWPA